MISYVIAEIYWPEKGKFIYFLFEKTWISFSWIDFKIMFKIIGALMLITTASSLNVAGLKSQQQSTTQDHITKTMNSHIIEKNEIKSERNFFLVLQKPHIIRNFSISKYFPYVCHYEYLPIDFWLIEDDTQKYTETTAFLDPSNVELQIEQKTILICRKISR